MKSIIKNLLIFIFLFQSVTFFSQGTQITVIHVNDTHSQLDGTGPRDANLNPTLGGISRAASIIGYLKATEQNPILLHGGDFSVGDFFFNKYYGASELYLLSSIGFDAMTVGNHEFDLGPSTLEPVLQEGFAEDSFPLVSANLDLSGYPSLSNYISQYTIKNFNGVKVGIFGMTIPAPLSNPAPVIIKENVGEIAGTMVQTLRTQEGCNVVIMLSHLGFENDKTLAENIPGIDFIVSAHDHYKFEQPQLISSTYIVEAGSAYQYIGKLKFTYNNGTVTYNSYELLPVTSATPPVPEIEGFVNGMKQEIELQYGPVYSTLIGTAAKNIETSPESNSNGWKDSPIGNLITDAYRNATETELAITANGLISGKLYNGPLVGADAFRAASYGYDVQSGLGFNLLLCEIKGVDLVKGLETSLSMLGIDNDFFVQVSGLRFTYNPQNPVGERVDLASIRINGSMIVPHLKYSLTLNEGLYGVLTSLGVKVKKTSPAGISEYDAIKNFITKLQTVSYSTEGRIKETSGSEYLTRPKEENQNSIKYILYNNYPNPFNPSTNIKILLVESANVKLVIYDALGREVETLADGLFKAGVYEYKWNAAAYSSGVYFYKLVSGNYQEIKRMVLVK